jgi:hypothetical protein
MTKKRPTDPMRLSEEDFSARITAYLEKFDAMPSKKQKAELIKFGWGNADGSVPVYPMDHVPLGPRE